MRRSVSWSSYTYTLPIYQFTHKWRRLTDDWNLSGIYTLQHGTPVGVFDFRDYGVNCDNNVAFFAGPGEARTARPWVSATPGTRMEPTHRTSTSIRRFHGSCFRDPRHRKPQPALWSGTQLRRLGAGEEIHIDESRYFELRLETYGTFNHANFANPSDNGFNSDDVQSLLGPRRGILHQNDFNLWRG